jgi:hypothetical protein
LIDSGYSQEAGVLIRTLHEHVGEIAFLLDGYGGADWPNGRQRDFIEHFYSVRVAEVDPKSGRLSDKPWVGRKKRQAGEARLLSPDDPHTPKTALHRIDTGYDAYVHAYYGAVMEMYAGPARGFRVRGVPDSRHSYSRLREVSFYVDRLMGYLAMYANARGMDALATRLIAQRENYQRIARTAG